MPPRWATVITSGQVPAANVRLRAHQSAPGLTATGRTEPLRVLERATGPWNGKGGTRAEALMRDPGVTDHLDAAAIERLTDPSAYLGQAPETVDRVLGSRTRGQ